MQKFLLTFPPFLRIIQETVEMEIKPQAHFQRAGAAGIPAESGADKWTIEGGVNGIGAGLSQ